MSDRLSAMPAAGVARRSQAAALVLLALIAIFHLVNNGLWVRTNQVVYGSDRMTHLVISLEYNDILSGGVNPRTLFSALTHSGYYPPLVHLTVAAFYKLFGVSMDVAALSNTLFLLLFLLAVYGLGERFGGPWVGLTSAAVVSTFPIIFSMSRYLYVDFALTAMVAVNVCLLVRSDRFRRRAYTLLYGLSLGTGMLVKWTFLAFTAPPLLVMLASPGTLPAVWSALRPAAWRGRRLLAAVLLGLGLTAAWFLPNVQATTALPLGYGLVPLSWVLWSITCYFLLAPPGRGSNLLAAVGLGISVAGSWYLTRIDFLQTFWLNAYGKPSGRSWGFSRYLDFLVWEQLSPLYALLLVGALLGLIGLRWRQTRRCRDMLNLGAEAWALVLWVLISYVVFSSRVSIVHSRYIMPLLPPLGVAIALWLSRVRPALVRALLTGLVMVAALFQFAALSFDALAGLQERLPVLADGLSIQLPASGRTDPGYWVVPDILEAVDEQRDEDDASLGLLVNQPQVNSLHFSYVAHTDYPHIQINRLLTSDESNPAYPRLFECDFALLIDPPPTYARSPDAVATLERLLSVPDDTFHRAYEPADTYSLPDGYRLLLYRRRFGPAQDADLAHYEALMGSLSAAAGPGDGVILVPPEQVYALARYGDGSLPLYPLPPEPRPPSEGDAAILEQLGARHSRLWVILGDTRQTDPASLVSGWLADRFYQADHAWYGPLQRLLVAAGGGTGEAITFEPGQATWQGGIYLQRVRLLDSSLPSGQILRLELVWKAVEPIGERYKVFVQLLDQGGKLAAQRDSEPAAGTRPTTEWQAGELVADRLGLWLPSDLPAGDYRLVLGLYEPETGERLPVCCPTSDSIRLAKVHVEGEVAHIHALDGN